MRRLFSKISTALILTVLFIVAASVFIACGKEDEPVYFTLTYQAQEGGSVSGDKEQSVQKGNDGSEVTAVPNEGYEFVKWSDDLTTHSRTDTNITESLTVTAYFEEIIVETTYFDVVYTAGEGGHIDGDETQSIAQGNDGTQVTAVPNEGYEFAKWSDDLTTRIRTDKNITESFTVTAYFEEVTVETTYFDITYTAGTGGIITGNLNQTIAYGDSATQVTATPNTGYDFVKWSDNNSTNPIRTDTNITTDITATAIFQKKQIQVTYSAGTGGTITGNTNQTIAYGESATQVTATPNTGYEFVKWSDNNSTNPIRTDINVISAITATAVFSKKQIQVTYTAGTGGTITGNLNQTVAYGSNATQVTATPNTGYKFVKWSDGVATASRADTNVIKSINAIAEFEKLTFAVKYSQLSYGAAMGSFEGETQQNVPYGEDGSPVTAIAKTGYKFVGWIISDDIFGYVTGEIQYTSATRQEKNVTGNIYAWAVFTSITFAVEYDATVGGSVNGKATQTIVYGANAETVTATPNTGYDFVKWSDNNSTNPIRTDTNITTDITATAIFQKKQIQVTYSAGTGGTITGNTNQTIAYGESATQVTATPNTGYEFAGWSDDATISATRHDKNITQEINVTAYFDKVVRTFTYVYNNATDINAAKNNTIESVEVKYETLNQTSFVLPIREHFTFDGWYLDKDFSVKVSDELGNLVAGNEIFNADSTSLYAKWNVIEEITYKILLVFVTEAYATLTTTNGTPVEVAYRMSDIERQICELIPKQMLSYLNSWFDGLVTFEVDSYFTTIPLGEENFNFGYDSGIRKTYSIYANDIPEVRGILDEYRSILTIFGMNDYDGLLHSNGGDAGRKYGCVHIEAFFQQLLINDIPLEILLDLEDSAWPHIIMSHIFHEFAHTVEFYYLYGEVHEYHKTVGAYPVSTDSTLKVTRLYLLNQAVLNGVVGGIPYSFWKNRTKTFTYVYNNATDINAAKNNTIESVEVKYETLNQTSFVLPIREHFTFDGWYLDKDFSIQVSDELGNLVIGNEIFNTASTNLYAKWTVIEEITYKILLVFVTEAYATLTTTNGTPVEVAYRMSDIERQICELIPTQMFPYLNSWFDGLVTFQIDSYFTTIPLSEENFHFGYDSGIYKSHSIYANNIPEVSGMLNEYRSVITIFGMNDYDILLHNNGGDANRKYACVHIEAFFSQLLANDIPLETLLNVEDPGWRGIMEHIFHEFSHTVELYYLYGEIHDYHSALAAYPQAAGMNLKVTGLYLLNQARLNGVVGGIPYSFWKAKAKTFAYVYNGATGNNTEESITLKCSSLFEVRLTVPTKIGFVFGGWYLEPNFKTRVTGEIGEMWLGLKIFDIESEYLYAKWLPA